jgi:plasmid replication initiation protein
MATSLEFAEPSGYGLGKSGWVTAVFDGNDVPGELLVEWLDESYRAVAPKRLVKQLDCDAALRAQKTKKLAKKTTRKKTTRKKTKKLKGKVLLVGFEELRLSRAADALVDAGCRAVTTRSPDGLANLKRRRFELLVVDVGRRPVSTLDAALERMELDPRAQAVFAGVRDAVFQRRVETEAPRKVACHRGPPGDPRVVAALLEHLR